MKKTLLLLATILSFAACQNDPMTEVVGGVNGPVTLTVTLDNTRTALGDKVGDNYPLCWSEGDKIVVNGVESASADIDKIDTRKASFTVQEPVNSPYHITYPYCEATTASQPKVNFPAEQTYTEGPFSEGCAPMCGYLAEKGVNVELKHLSGIMRFPIKAEIEGVALSKIVVTSSSAKLSGDFNVNCQSATLVAAEGAQNSVTYNLPSNFALSTTSEQVVYIALPAVAVESCIVEIVDTEERVMTLAWKGGTIKPGIVREFKTIPYKPNNSASLDPFEVEEDMIITASACGYVKDTNGNPIPGVAVTDGFSVVSTDSNGFYELDTSKDAWFIYVTVPAEYEIPVENNQPAFYQKYDKDRNCYDFTLKPLEGGKEQKFALFVFGDPQVSNTTHLQRLKEQIAPCVKEHASTLQSQGVPCYGMTLGDLISNVDGNDVSYLRDDVYDSFSVANTGMPVFHVMGNHDHTFFDSNRPIYADHRSSTWQLKAQRAHEEIFGPVNFSFERGDMHIISMRNVWYTYNYTSSKIYHSLLDEHLEWLRQDLALVPKDKTVILCVHIQFQDYDKSNFPQVRELINGYKEAHIMSGHTHLIQHIKGASPNHPNIFEHNMGALCGAWWTSHMCGDGSPAGYGVFIGEGTTFTDWYHLGYSNTSKYRSHQMRLYRGNDITGAAIPADPNQNSQKTKGYFAFNFDEDVLLANVYMADSEWSVKVYEDGEYSGEMEHISVENGILTDAAYYSRPRIFRNSAADILMIGDGSLENPFRAPDDLPTAGDIYASGYINGVRGYQDFHTGSNSQCYHMYMYKLKKGDFSKVRVEATDRFGHVYTETKVTKGTDYSLIKY